MTATPDTASETQCAICGGDVFDGCTCPAHPTDEVRIAAVLIQAVGPDGARRVLSALQAESLTVVSAPELALFRARATELQIAIDRIAACHQPHLALSIARAAEYGKTRFGV